MIYELTIKKTVLNDCTPEPVTSPMATIRYLREHVFDPEELWREKSYALFLDSGNRITGHILVGIGGVSSVTIDKRIVAKGALDVMASGVILAHNHPSGDPSPSISDIKQTEDLKKGLDTLDIKLIDHIILTEKKAYSFSSEQTYIL